MRGHGSDTELRPGFPGGRRLGARHRRQSQFHSSQGQLEDVLRTTESDVRAVGHDNYYCDRITINVLPQRAPN